MRPATTATLIGFLDDRSKRMQDSPATAAVGMPTPRATCDSIRSAATRFIDTQAFSSKQQCAATGFHIAVTRTCCGIRITTIRYVVLATHSSARSSRAASVTRSATELSCRTTSPPKWERIALAEAEWNETNGCCHVWKVEQTTRNNPLFVFINRGRRGGRW